MTETDTGGTEPRKTDTGQEKQVPKSLKRVIMVDGKLVELTPASKPDLAPGTLAQPKKYGLWDTKALTWMGTATEPLTYDDPTVAQVAAQVMDERLGQPMGRTRAQQFTKADVKGEDLHPTVSPEEAMRRVFGDE